MRLRRLGRTDLQVSPVTFGCMRLGGAPASDTEADRSRVLHAALDAGIRGFDTAPLYDLGGSERLLGRVLRGRRNDVVVMTKVGLRWDDPRGRPMFPVVDAGGMRRWVHKNSRPDSIRWEVDQSLKRLGLEHLDLVQVHQRDEETPLEETLGVLVDLRRAGKVRALGVSNFTPADLAATLRILGDVPLASVSPKLNLLERAAESAVLPLAREHGVAVLAYSPLRQGLLTGALEPTRPFPPGDFRHGLPAFSPEGRARVNALLARVAGPMAERHGVSVAEVSLAWVLHQAGVTSAIVGASTPAQVVALARSAEVTLTGMEVLELREALSPLAEAMVGSGLWGRLRRKARGLLRGDRSAGESR